MRFIPAYTGNIRPEDRIGVLKPVHPRIHGEHCNVVLIEFQICGSSPHTRGTYLAGCQPALLSRFIPAYTGNILRFCSFWIQHTVHPRIHGEHNTFLKIIFPSVGSSPHTRGTCACNRARRCERRFIPAYTGNMLRLLCWCLAVSVHPRIHGEHVDR